MADYSYAQVMSLLEHGFTGVIRKLDGTPVQIGNVDEFRRKFAGDEDMKFRLIDFSGDYVRLDAVEKASSEIHVSKYTPWVQKYDYEGDPRKAFVLQVALEMAQKRGVEGVGEEAVKGYIISRLESIIGRVEKYYGVNWVNFIKSASPFRNVIVTFLKRYLRKGIDEIALNYREGLFKANYLNENEGMTHMMNVNYEPVVDDQKAMVDTGADEAVNPDLYREEMNRINEMKRKRKAPEGLYQESKTQQKLKE